MKEVYYNVGEHHQTHPNTQRVDLKAEHRQRK